MAPKYDRFVMEWPLNESLSLFVELSTHNSLFFSIVLLSLSFFIFIRFGIVSSLFYFHLVFSFSVIVTVVFLAWRRERERKRENCCYLAHSHSTNGVRETNALSALAAQIKSADCFLSSVPLSPELRHQTTENERGTGKTDARLLLLLLPS